MFERFESTKPNGLGMGLAISRSIMQAHRGRNWATRNDDRGLSLHVVLPVASSPPAPALRLPSAARASHRFTTPAPRRTA
jgi:signal transduction histidine kinase